MIRHFLARVASPAQTPRGFSTADSPVPEQPAVVLVVVDASKTLEWHALFHAFKYVVHPGEKLVLFGIIHHIPTLLGYKIATTERDINATNERALQQEKIRVSQIYETALQPFAECCDKRQVLLEFMIGTGPSFSGVLLPQATKLQPRCIVLDRHLKSQKICWAQKLTCELLLMNKKNKADIVAGKIRSVS